MLSLIGNWEVPFRAAVSSYQAATSPSLCAEYSVRTGLGLEVPRKRTPAAERSSLPVVGLACLPFHVVEN